MPNIPARALRSPRTANRPFALVCACALLCAGCVTKRRPAPTLGVVVLSHPVLPAAEKIAMEDAPEIIPTEGERIPQLVVPHATPAKPRVAPAPTKESAQTDQPPEPLIAPELTDEQLSAAKGATQQSLAAAERNLNLARGQSLNDAQQDLVSKILGFLDSAREAMRNNDWQRARIQAKKAEVLSQEFAPKP